MNKLYLFTLSIFCFSLALNAQFTDDIESYDEGPLFTDMWTTWDGNNDGSQNAIVSTDFAASGEKSIFIGPGQGPQDAVLDFGGVATSGSWRLSWLMYIPGGNSGYINLQGNVSPSANDNLQFLSGNIFFNEANGSPGMGQDDNGNGPNTFNFPHDAWFPVEVVVDLTNSTYTFTINETELNTSDFNNPTITEFGGLDLFAIDAQNTYYVDDFTLEALVSSVDDLNSFDFSIYPNPVQDVLTINSPLIDNNIQVFDLLGKRVFETYSNANISTIDLSDLNSGIYFVNITSGDYSSTVKFMK